MPIYKTQRVSLLFGESIDDWGKERILQLKQTICEISGADIDSIQNFKIRSACVIVVFDLDRASAERFVSLINKFRNSDKSLSEHDKQLISDFTKRFRLQNTQIGPPLIPESGYDYVAPTNSNLIFLVHGWRGDGDSFGKLPEMLKQNTGCECRRFVYPTGFLETSSPIHYVSKAFDNWIRNETDNGARKFAIIAHSMGGVVSRATLSSQLVSKRPLDKKVRQITFVASPLGGAWLAKLAKNGPGSTLAQVAELAPNSIFMEQVKTGWSSWIEKQNHLNGRVRSIYSPNDEVVDTVSAVGEDPEAVPILGSRHSDIIKPENETDEIVRTLSRFINETDLCA